ncbi:RNA polymerase sigma factor [Oceanirhabdus sp. W0125-5]|uniref:RNA polymerase sigma factor n=1 Tax=Oceanirhabdus sp. W0125-5 TaxID=2999116 RepID=UPI0022F2BF7D|nr:sigma-70 family RNA polymerase sigma factor [Oceanirhabdus sp. W0125-5]WBW96581.1 sigma-70 family RNA polymerase sigma factor [Oceanirhabdus sp. W0125-5]
MMDILNCDKDNFFEFQNVTRKIHKDLYIFLYSMCEDNYIVKDAMRNVLLKGYKRFNTFNTIEDFKICLFKIAKLEMNNIIKKNNRYNDRSIELYKTITVDKRNYGNQQDKLVKKDTKEMIMEAVESLDKNLREIMILKYYYNLSFEKIAEIQECDINIIKLNHKNAKWAIKEYLCEAFDI